MTATSQMVTALTWSASASRIAVRSPQLLPQAAVIGSFAVATGLLAVTLAGWWALGTLPPPTGRDLALGVGVGLIPEHVYAVEPGDYAARPPDTEHAEFLLHEVPVPPRVPRSVDQHECGQTDLLSDRPP